MNLIELMREGELNPLFVLFSFLFLVGTCALFSLMSFLLAKSKNRNRLIATVLGIIPVLNVLTLGYYYLVSNIEE